MQVCSNSVHTEDKDKQKSLSIHVVDFDNFDHQGQGYTQVKVMTIRCLVQNLSKDQIYQSMRTFNQQLRKRLATKSKIVFLTI